MISIFIVTYNNPLILEKNLESLFAADLNGHQVSINIINNHTNFYLHPKFESIKVLHNQTRPDFSTGHLSRNWNQAIINGFQNLARPACDILITSQDDVTWQPNFINCVLQNTEQYSFISVGSGDAVCIYKPEAIKRIGIWDEHFCNIGHQEGDYFLRARIYNRLKSSINDHFHRRVLNPIENEIINNDQSGFERKEDHHMKSMQYHHISEKYFLHKWNNFSPVHWPKLEDEFPKHPKIKNFMLYPYFETKINQKLYALPIFQKRTIMMN